MDIDTECFKWMLPNLKYVPPNTKNYLSEQPVKYSVTPVCIIKMDTYILCLENESGAPVFVRCNEILTEHVNDELKKLTSPELH